MANTGIIPAQYPKSRAYLDAVIADGETLSNAISISGLHLVAVQRPASSGVTSLSFELSGDNINWYPLRDSLDEDISLTIGSDAAHQRVSSVMDFEGASFIKLKSNTAVSGDKNFTLVLANL